MVKRQIRYYVRTNTDEQASMRHEWTFLIVNEPREIKRITQKLLDYLAPVDNFMDICDASAPYSKGIHCKVLCFSSEKGKLEDKSKIYASKNFRRDRDLARDRVTWSAWYDYASKFI
jgi:hypothetical protein